MMRTDIARYWRELAAVIEAMPVGPVARMADLLFECHERGNTVFVVGNGGSAATASHFACDLAKGTRTDGIAPFRVLALTDNVPLLTAWANDLDYARVFAEQLSALVRGGDVVVAISASGNSPNVLAAVELGRLAGAVTIALTGQSGGRLTRLAHLTVRVPADAGERIEQVEDAHLAIGHSLCVALRQRLSGRRRGGSARERRQALPATVADLIVMERAADATIASS
jgi:D-sedoheptulose 7-phosphate isomerase